MRRWGQMLLAGMLLLSLSACTAGSPTPSGDPTEGMASQSQTQPGDTISAAGEDGKKALVVYFSWSGNTERVAEEIQRQTGADLFEIVPEAPYPDEYAVLTELAQEERRQGVRPSISGTVDGIDGYDTLYLGYPIWWGDMPMVLYTFLESYDLSGKQIAPFCTSGGSGLSGTVDAIRATVPEAEVLEGLHLGSSASAEPQDGVTRWLESLGSPQ